MWRMTYMTSDESACIPTHQDNGFVGEVTVYLVDKFITQWNHLHRHIVYKINK